MVVANSKINNDKNERQIAGNFDCHADAVVRCRVHCLMEHIQGFPRSHWMPPLGKWLCHIALAATMVEDFGCKQKTLTKDIFLLVNLR
jgi:hypothetical protein